MKFLMIEKFYLTHRWDPLTCTTNPVQSGAGSNGDEDVLPILQNSWIARLSDAV